MPHKPPSHRPARLPCPRSAADVERDQQLHRKLLKRKAWRVFRLAFLAHPDNVICADCKREPSTEVHHVRKFKAHLEDYLDPAECLGLCKACHSVRTGRGE